MTLRDPIAGETPTFPGLDVRKNLLLRDHSGFPRIIEQPARIDHWAHIAQGLEPIDFASALHSYTRGIKIHGHHIPCLENIAESFGHFARVKLTGRDAVSEEN